MTTVQAYEPVPAPGRPLLKWAGGKRQLLPALRGYYPVTFRRYIEPSFGSGAVFFDLHAGGRLDGRQAWLVDDNADLVGCYRMLMSRTDEVIAHLRLLAEDHRARGSECYYDVRDARFNPMRAASGAYTPEMAAMLIYLNRTGFNGLFRLNKSGAFNVPAGRYVNPRIVDEGHLRQVAAALRTRGVTLVHGSFDGALRELHRQRIHARRPGTPAARARRRGRARRGGRPFELVRPRHRAAVFDDRRAARAVAHRPGERAAGDQLARRRARLRDRADRDERGGATKRSPRCGSRRAPREIEDGEGRPRQSRCGAGTEQRNPGESDPPVTTCRRSRRACGSSDTRTPGACRTRTRRNHRLPAGCTRDRRPAR